MNGPISQSFLPRYEVLDTLGEGAVATVYTVRAQRDDAVYALKALKPEQARTARAIGRFEDEFRILRRLHHPSLPEMYDYGITADGTRYMVMEHVEGVPLDRYLADHKDELWLLIYQLTEALAFVHEHGLLHLDLKPGNTLIKRTAAAAGGERPMVMLIDFGLSYARDVGGEAKMSGTPDYMPPEIIRADDSLTRAADYYSLGVILYELVEGKTPFAGTLHEVLQAHLSRTPEFSETKVEYAELYPWIERLLDKEVGPRLEAFQEFRRAMADRVGDPPEGLERAYALGYIESLGLIGKTSVYEGLREWSCDVRGALDARTAGEDGAVAEGATAESAAVENTAAEDVAKTLGIGESVDDLLERMQGELLAEATEKAGPARIDPEALKRYVTLAGPPESGKTYLLETLMTDLLPRAFSVVVLDDDRVYESLVGAEETKRPGRGIDPGSIMVDRFRRGWEWLQTLARPGGVVIEVDDFGSLAKEKKDFLGHVISHTELAITGGDEPCVLFVIADQSLTLGKELKTLGAREGATLAFEMPPPTSKDVEVVLDEFHGHMSGVEERRALARYVESHLESSGAVMMALRQAVADRDLRYEKGRWRFKAPAGAAETRKLSSSRYYQNLLKELPVAARELLRWLCAHPGALSLGQAGELTQIGEEAMEQAIESIRPYRVLDLYHDGGNERLRFASAGIRNAFYSGLDEEDRRQLHRAYVDYLSGYRDVRMSGLEDLAFHCERAGLVREALLKRVKAVRLAKSAKDVSSLRRFCEGGMNYVRALDDTEWGEKKWLWERYFIKSCIDAEWMVSSYGTLVALVDDCFEKRQREVPLSFIYKYGTALERSGDLPACEKVVERAMSRMPDKKPRGTYINILLVDALRSYMANQYDKSLQTLAKIRTEQLDPSTRAIFYVTYMLNYDGLGDQTGWERYEKLATTVAIQITSREPLLRIKFLKSKFYIRHALYRKAMAEITTSIRLASRHRMYRSLALMYFQASAVYHEKGEYRKTLNYLDKAIRVVVDIGMLKQAAEYTMRYAIIYQNMGLYGNAIRYAKSAVAQFAGDPWLKQYCYALGILFELFVCLHNESAERYWNLLRPLLDGMQSKARVAYTYLVSGDYSFKGRRYDRALRAYKTSQNIFESVGVLDDAAIAQVRTGNVYVALGKFDECRHEIENLEQNIRKFESDNIRIEFEMLKLNYEYRRAEDATAIRKCLSICEQESSKIEKFDVGLAMNALLFRVHSSLNEYEKAERYFNEYYLRVKKLCGNLPSARQVQEYVRNPEFTELVTQFKRIKKKNPSHGSGD